MDNKALDQALVARVQRGDKAAFDILVSKYQNKVINLVNRYVRNPDDAMDVSQEAFIKAYRALSGFRGESAFYTWLYRIAINTAKNWLVAQGRRPPGSDVELDTAELIDDSGRFRETETPENLAEQDEVAATIRQAINALPEDLKTAITLREVEGLSYEEIATTMSCPVGTVRSRIFRAREAIDKRLKPLLEN